MEPDVGPRKSSAKRAGGITIAGQLVKALVQFGGLIAFSHLLTPRDVGLIAMLAVFLYLGELIRDFGLSQAAIQSANLTHGQASNLFWTNLAIGSVMTVALSLAAPAVAHMYGEPALRDVAPWIALSFIVNALQTQFQVRLARDLRFAALTITDCVSQVAGLAAGLVAAIAGASYWSLVIQMLAVYTSLFIQRAVVAKWLPGRPRREPGMVALYSFGFHSGLAQLVQYAASNVDTLTIGIRWGATALGIYNRAFQMFSVPASQLLTPLTNVALPLLSKQRHEGGDFYPLLWKAQVALGSGFTLIFVLAASLSEPLVRVVLGTEWRDAAPLLSILSIGGAVQVLSYMAYWAFLASGNARQLFFHSLVTKPLLAVCIILGSFAGIQGVAWGFSVGLLLSWFISLQWLKRCDGMPVQPFLRAGVHVLSCGGVSGGSSWILVNSIDGHLPTALVILCGFALSVCIYLPALFSRRLTRQFLLQTLRPALRRVGMAANDAHSGVPKG